jgi:hypothetical protein
MARRARLGSLSTRDASKARRIASATNGFRCQPSASARKFGRVGPCVQEVSPIPIVIRSDRQGAWNGVSRGHLERAQHIEIAQ